MTTKNTNNRSSAKPASRGSADRNPSSGSRASASRGSSSAGQSSRGGAGGQRSNARVSTSAQRRTSDRSRSSARGYDDTRTKGRAGEREQLQYREEKMEIRDEIFVIVSLLISVLFVLSYLNLCGSLGDILNLVVFGLFGSFGYVFPFALFFINLFAISNKHNRSIGIKLVYCLLMLVFITGIVQMAVGGYDETIVLKDYFTNSIPGYVGRDKTYGGILGGALCVFLCPLVDDIAAVCIMVAFVLIFFVLIAGKAIFTSLTRDSIDKTRKLHERYVEEREERRYEESIIREERQERKRRRNDLSEEALEELEAISRGKVKKESFIDRLMRKGMALEDDRISDMPEYRRLTEKHGKTPDELSEIRSDAAQDREGRDKKEAEPKDFVTSQLDEKFGGSRGRDERPVIERSRINNGNVGRTYMIDDDPEDESAAHSVKPIPGYSSRYAEAMAAKRNAENAEKEESVPENAPAHPITASDVPAAPKEPSEEKQNIVDLSERRRKKGLSEQESVKDSEQEDTASDIGESGRTEENSEDDTAPAISAKTAMADRTSSGGVCFTDMSAVKDASPQIPPYVFPPIDLLSKGKNRENPNKENDLREVVDKLQSTFESFGVGVRVTNATCGPTVTRYEILPDQGVKVKTITALADDIKLALAAAEIRIEAPIPGKAAVGIEVPNRETSPVVLRDLIDSPEFKDAPSNLTFAVGKDIGGKTICFDIGSMPHMLIAGATGSGKSVCINALIMSILYKAKPSDVRMIMIDPKRVELIGYNGIPHLLVPVVTDVKKASGALNWAIAEMDDRYERFAENGVNNLASYNRLMEEKYFEAGNEGECPDRLPQIVIIVDELNDLMMTANSKEVEASICRLTQLARASGIHVVLATQRPSVNVITGTIKANIPSRIAFSVSSIVDSRTIIDQAGAEKLLGKGDMLFYPQGYPKPVRLQGAYVSDREVAAVVDFVKSKCREVKYNELISKHIDENSAGVKPSAEAQKDKEQPAGDEFDEFFEEAGRFIIEKNKASIGMLQRAYKIGFNRAARIMDQLADEGVVGPEEGTKPRKILMSLAQFNAYVSGGDPGDAEESDEHSTAEDTGSDDDNE